MSSISVALDSQCKVPLPNCPVDGPIRLFLLKSQPLADRRKVHYPGSRGLQGSKNSSIRMPSKSALSHFTDQKRLSTDLESVILSNPTPCQLSNNVSCDTLPKLYHEKKRQSGRSVTPLPDAVELSEIQRTQNTYNSNLFKLQIDQLLKEATVDYTKLSALENFLKLLKTRIDLLENAEINSQDVQTRYPFVEFVFPPTSSRNSAFSFTFQPPSRTDLVGSYLLKTVTRPNLNIDIAIEMPVSIFEPKDHLHYRYFNKRSAYIAETYRQLRNLFSYTRSEESSDRGETRSVIPQGSTKNPPHRKETKGAMKHSMGNEASQHGVHSIGDPSQDIRPYFFLQAWQGDTRRPIIVVKCLIPKYMSHMQNAVPNDRTHRETTWTVRLFPVPPQNVFSEKRLTPLRNSVRRCTTSATPELLEQELEKQTHVKAHLPPTPMYNGALLEDVRMVSWVQRLHEVTGRFSGFKDAIKLLKLWARQRGHCASWSSHRYNTKCPGVEADGRCDQDAEEWIISPVNGFVLTVICAHICLSDIAGMTAASSFQLFKLALVFLAETNFNETKAIFGHTTTMTLTEEEKRLGLYLFLDYDQQEQMKNPPPTLLTYNIFWMLQLSLTELQGQASESVTLLKSLEDPFDHLFGLRFDPLLNWDITIAIRNIPDIKYISAASLVPDSDERDRLRHVHGHTERDPSCDRSQINPYIDLHIEHPVHFNVVGSLFNILKRGLTDRIKNVGGICVRFLCPKSPTVYKTKGEGVIDANDSEQKQEWRNHHPLENLPPFSWTDTSPLSMKMNALVAVVLSDENRISDGGSLGSPLWRLVDRGVSANSPLAKHFKAFWGNSSVRRFQDGAINESVVWDRPTPFLENVGLVKMSSKTVEATKFTPSVPSQIITHLVNRYFGTSFTTETAITTRLRSKSKKMSVGTQRKGKIFINDASLGVPSRPVMSLMTPTGNPVPHPATQFPQLKNIIVGLPDIPLDIKELRVADNSGILRYSDLPFHCPFSNKESVEEFSYASEIIVDCVIEFAKSGGWPTDQEAIKQMKAAVLIAIRSSLLSTTSIEGHIGGLLYARPRDGCIINPPTLSDPYLDIVYPPVLKMVQPGQNFTEPYLPRVIYRIRIFHPFEHLTVATALTETKIDSWISNNGSTFSSMALEDTRCLWWRPAITALLHGTTLKSACFAPALRLIKFWCSRHQFPLDQVTELIEHLTLHIFTNPSSYLNPPTTPHVALARFFHLLTTHNWSNEGLYINGDSNLPFLSQSTSTELKNCYEKRLDIHRNTSASDNSKLLQPPYFWVASTLDPYCQFIRLPTMRQSKQLVDVARTAYSQHHFLPKSSWNLLFDVNVAERFDLLIKFVPTIEAIGKFGSKKRNNVQQVIETDGFPSRPKQPFKNIRKSQSVRQSIPTSSIRGPGDVSINSDRDEANITEASALLEQALPSPVRGKHRSSKYSEKRLSGDSFNDYIKHLEPHLGDSHTIMSILQDSFQQYIQQLRVAFGGLCDFYYDSLALPYPLGVYVKINVDGMAPNDVSPSSSGCPKVVYQQGTITHNDSTSDSEESCTSGSVLRESSLYEIPNSVLLLGMMTSIGSSIVSEIQIL